MIKGRMHIWVVLTLAVGLFFIWVSSPHSPHFTNPPANLPHEDSSILDRARPREVAKYTTTVLSTNDTFSVEELQSLLEDINPSNDWVVHLQKESKIKIVRDPQKYGIEVIDQIEEINTIRFRISSPSQALPFLKKLIKKDALSPNFPLRSPLPPRGDAHSFDFGFGAGFIEWLGGNSQRKNIGENIKIALLDSGVDVGHPALSEASVSEKNFLPADTGLEGQGHGTALSSVIAGNFGGISGVSPGSEILSYRVVNEHGEADSHTVAHAIVTAVQDGADIINLSLGGEQGSSVLEQAVKYAHSEGVVVVAAVGNDGVGLVNYPAFYDGVVGVTSISKAGSVSRFANFGEGVDLAAPGVGVLAAWEGDEMVGFSGTSVATAIVSGAIASEMSREPNLTSADVVDLLYHTANENGEKGVDEISGHGVVSLARLENRTNKAYEDPAIVGYHFPHLQAVGGATMPFEVIVQNQGNQPVHTMQLQVDYPGVQKTFLINNLQSGETRHETLYLQGSGGGQILEIRSELILPFNQEDSRKDNNLRISVIEL
jgi:hypothetical protein